MVAKARSGVVNHDEEEMANELDESVGALDTTQQSSKNYQSNFSKNSTLKNPKLSLSSSTNNSELQTKLRKLQELSSGDKDVIESLQKKIQTYKLDLETLQQKYSSLQRNYEGVSNYAASDKAEYQKLRTLKEVAEKESAEFKKKNVELEVSVRDLRLQVDQLSTQLSDYKNKMDAKVRECDKLKEDQKKRDKANEDKLNLVNQSNKQLNEANVKMKGELKKLQEENNELKTQIEQLRNDQSKNHEMHLQVELFRQKEEEMETQIHMWSQRAKSAEDEVRLSSLTVQLQTRIIETEDLLGQNKKLTSENSSLQQHLQKLQKLQKDLEIANKDLQTKLNETSCNLQIEQESGLRLKNEKDLIEKQLKECQSEIDTMQKDSSLNSTQMGQKLKEMEAEKKVLKTKIEQLETDIYRINREKSEFALAKDKLQNEIETIKNQNGEVQKDLNNYKESNSNLQTQIVFRDSQEAKQLNELRTDGESKAGRESSSNEEEYLRCDIQNEEKF